MHKDKESSHSLSSVNQQLEKILKYQDIILLHTRISDLHIRYKKYKYKNKSSLTKLVLSMAERIRFYHQTDPTCSLWFHYYKELNNIIFTLINVSSYQDKLDYCVTLLTTIIGYLSSSDSI